MADHPLKPATDHRLGEPLPHQQANRTQTPPAAVQRPFLKHPTRHPSSCGITLRFRRLAPTTGQVAHVFLTRPPRKPSEDDPVRLACIRHAASVDPEPGSNSPPILLPRCTPPVRCRETPIRPDKATGMLSRLYRRSGLNHAPCRASRPGPGPIRRSPPSAPRRHHTARAQPVAPTIHWSRAATRPPRPQKDDARLPPASALLRLPHTTTKEAPCAHLLRCPPDSRRTNNTPRNVPVPRAEPRIPTAGPSPHRAVRISPSERSDHATSTVRAPRLGTLECPLPSEQQT